MSKRLAVMALYCKTGIVPRYVYKILRELRSVAEKLIVVCNGELQEEEKGNIGENADLVLERENSGFDAGAYKFVLFEHIGSAELEKYDELILCNDTFFGFFRPLVDIFDDMGKVCCDFWGLNRVSNGILEYIESYFLVFRKSVLRAKCFWNYWENNINESETNIEEVYIRFEQEVYLWLCENGYKPDAYTEMNHLKLYEDSFHCVTEYHLPIIKKKAFSKAYFNHENILATLDYIDRETKYDIDLILKEVEKEYDLAIDILTIGRNSWKTAVPERREMNMSICAGPAVRTFSEKGKCYIYGAGLYGKLIYRNYVKKENIIGFLVSDPFRGEKRCEGKKVISIARLGEEEKKNARIILALSAENTRQVLSKMADCGEALMLWRD